MTEAIEHRRVIDGKRVTRRGGAVATHPMGVFDPFAEDDEKLAMWNKVGGHVLHRMALPNPKSYPWDMVRVWSVMERGYLEEPMLRLDWARKHHRWYEHYDIYLWQTRPSNGFNVVDVGEWE